MWVFLVSEPLTVADSLNWRFLFSGTASAWFLERGFGFGSVLGINLAYSLALIPVALKNILLIVINTLDVFVRVKRLPVQVRTAVALLASAPTLTLTPTLTPYCLAPDRSCPPRFHHHPHTNPNPHPLLSSSGPQLLSSPPPLHRPAIPRTKTPAPCPPPTQCCRRRQSPSPVHTTTSL